MPQLVNFITVTAVFSIFISSLAGFLVGSLWYSPFGFGKKWLKLKKVNPKQLKDTKKAMAYGFVIHLVMAYFMYIFVVAFGATSLLGGLVVGLYVGIGFVATSMLLDYIYEPVLELKNSNLLILNASHRIVTLAVMGGVIGVVV